MMNWLKRFRKPKEHHEQTITLWLSPEEWAELQEWAKSSDWTLEYMVTRWVQNRMHGTGRIGN